MADNKPYNLRSRTKRDEDNPLVPDGQLKQLKLEKARHRAQRKREWRSRKRARGIMSMFIYFKVC